MDAESNKTGLLLFTEADSPSGVDDYLLLDQLRRTPEERLEWAERMLAEMRELRAHARRIPEAVGRPKDKLALLYLERVQELDSRSDEVLRMLEQLDREAAQTPAEPSED